MSHTGNGNRRRRRRCQTECNEVHIVCGVGAGRGFHNDLDNPYRTAYLVFLRCRRRRRRRHRVDAAE